MRSVRLGEELERRLERAADATGQSASEIVRRAVREECDEILGSTVYEAIADLVGCAADKGRGRQKRSEFVDYLLEKHSPARQRKLAGTKSGGPPRQIAAKSAASEQSRPKRKGDPQRTNRRRGAS